MQITSQFFRDGRVKTLWKESKTIVGRLLKAFTDVIILCSQNFANFESTHRDNATGTSTWVNYIQSVAIRIAKVVYIFYLAWAGCVAYP